MYEKISLYKLVKKMLHFWWSTSFWRHFYFHIWNSLLGFLWHELLEQPTSQLLKDDDVPILSAHNLAKVSQKSGTKLGREQIA